MRTRFKTSNNKHGLHGIDQHNFFWFYWFATYNTFANGHNQRPVWFIWMSLLHRKAYVWLFFTYIHIQGYGGSTKKKRDVLIPIMHRFWLVRWECLQWHFIWTWTPPHCVALWDFTCNTAWLPSYFTVCRVAGLKLGLLVGRHGIGFRFWKIVPITKAVAAMGDNSQNYQTGNQPDHLIASVHSEMFLVALQLQRRKNCPSTEPGPCFLPTGIWKK